MSTAPLSAKGLGNNRGFQLLERHTENKPRNFDPDKRHLGFHAIQLIGNIPKKIRQLIIGLLKK